MAHKLCSDRKSGLSLDLEDFVQIKSGMGTFFGQNSFGWGSGPPTYYRGSCSTVSDAKKQPLRAGLSFGFGGRGF